MVPLRKDSILRIIVFCVSQTLAVSSGNVAPRKDGGQLGITEEPREQWMSNITQWSLTINKGDYWLNTFMLIVKSDVNASLEIYWQNLHCFGCNTKRIASIPPKGNWSDTVQSSFENRLEVRNVSSDVLCGGEFLMSERGEYWLIIHGQVECALVLANDPPNIYLPILYAFLFFLGLAIVYVILKCLYLRLFEDKNQKSVDLWTTEASAKQYPESFGSVNTISLVIFSDENEQGKILPSSTNGAVSGSGTGNEPAAARPAAKAEPPAKERLGSLDTFRGTSLAIMIFVNYGGGGYYFFGHAAWDGLMVADLVFPWFLFIMGASIAFAMRSFKRRKTPWYKILYKIIKRTVILWFFFGICLSTSWGLPYMPEIRIPGIMQLLAFSYFFTSLPHLFVSSPTDKNAEKRWAPVRDILNYWPEWIFMFGLIATHLGLLLGLPVPDCPTGYLGPGGDHNGGHNAQCSGGAASYIDRLVFTDDHIYNWATYKELYNSQVNHDPEGITGILTSIFICFLGLQAGKIIQTYPTHTERIVRWLIWGVVTFVIGLVLSQATLYGGWIPINKNLWSVSFVMILVSFAYFLLVFFYVLIDVAKIWSGAPFKYPGMNSIVIYSCHSIFSQFFPVAWVIPDYEDHGQRLYMNLWSTCVFLVLSYWLYWKKIFVAI